MNKLFRKLKGTIILEQLAASTGSPKRMLIGTNQMICTCLGCGIRTASAYGVLLQKAGSSRFKDPFNYQWKHAKNEE